MRRTIATFLLASFALLVTTFAGLSVFGMSNDVGMDTSDCAGTHCMPMNDMPAAHGNSSANDLGCINDCLSSATALTNAVLPMPLALGFFALLSITLVSEIVAFAQKTLPTLKEHKRMADRMTARQQ